MSMVLVIESEMTQMTQMTQKYVADGCTQIVGAGYVGAGLAETLMDCKNIAYQNPPFQRGNIIRITMWGSHQRIKIAIIEDCRAIAPPPI